MSASTWPFRVSLQDHPLDGVTYIAISGNVSDAAVIRNLDFALKTFIDLASCGGLAGELVDPSRSASYSAITAHLNATASLLNWTVHQLDIDARLYCVLLNMIESLCDQIEAVVITVNFKGKRLHLPLETYPSHFLEPMFLLVDERVSRSLEVEIEFRDELRSDRQTNIREILESWMLVGLLGGFRSHGRTTIESIVPVFDIFFYKEKIASFSIEVLSASSGSIDSLINCLEWISIHIAKVERVEID